MKIITFYNQKNNNSNISQKCELIEELNKGATFKCGFF